MHVERERTSMVGQAVSGEPLRDHEASRCWRRVRPEAPDPERIEVLKQGSKGGVYRLSSAAGGAVIAKRCRPEKGRRERAVYEQVLSALPEPPLAYHGAVDDGAWVWLFIEDVGDRRLDASNADHAAAAAGWLGRLHAAVAEPAVAAEFPERGAGQYFEDLQSLRRALQPESAMAVVKETGARLRAVCDRLEDLWPSIERLCGEVPRVFSHNDCLPKNIHVRAASATLRIAAFDWGGAGWAPLAADLGLLRLPASGPPAEHPDYAAYGRAVRARFPEADAGLLARLAAIGQLFWGLKVASRGVVDLADYGGQTRYQLDKLAVYEQALTRSARALAAA